MCKSTSHLIKSKIHSDKIDESKETVLCSECIKSETKKGNLIEIL